MKTVYGFIIALLLLHHTALARNYQPVTFVHDGLTVNARLSLPDGPSPYQVIIIAPGSGANDKDGTLPMIGGNVNCLYSGLHGDTIRTYKGLSDALTDSGFAVLTYDKLEYSYPTSMGTITFHNLWLPVESAINYLKTRTDIDTGNMVLLGHSEGSTLIPYIARTQPSVKALISLAGARRSVYDTLLSYQLFYIANACGGDTAAARAQGAQLVNYFNAIRSGSWSASTPPFAGVSAAVWSDYVKVADSVAINYDLCARPMLFVGLGNDINVPISTELSKFRADITKPADFYEVAGLNHYLTTSNNPAVSEVLTDTLVYWLRSHVPALGVPHALKPTQATFNVVRNTDYWQISSTEPLREVAVFDLSGRCIYRSAAQGNSHKVALSFVAEGLYLLHVRGISSESVIKVQR